MKSIYLKTAVATALLGGAVLAFGAGPGGSGGGGGGGGSGGPPEGHGPPVSEAGNNLSVPLVMINGGFMLNCDENAFTALDAVEGEPIWYDGLCIVGHDGEVCVEEGNYFVQGVHKWQAPCMNKVFAEGDPKIDVFGAWGDNLSGDAKLKVGSPIRVELTLWDRSGLAQQDGYTVVKLEPDALDRESAYGTLAADGGAGTFVGQPVLMEPLVHDGEATFSVQHVDSGEYAVDPGTNPTAEINATGKIVYGYNLRVGAVGEYDITFTVPNVNFTGCNHTDVCAGNSTTLRIEVIGGGGGGGGKNSSLSTSGNKGKGRRR